MTAKLIDGKAAAAAFASAIAGEVARLRERPAGRRASRSFWSASIRRRAAYVRSKAKATREAGMESFEHKLPATISPGRADRRSSTS